MEQNITLIKTVFPFHHLVLQLASHHDSKVWQYDKTYKDVDERTGKFTITKAWTESEGLVWVKDKGSCCPGC